MYIEFLKRRNLTPEGDGGNGDPAPVTIDFAANEAAFIAHMQGKGMVIASKEAIQKDYVNPAVEKTHSDWEAGVAEVLGETKPAGKKGLSWVKETLPEKIKTKPADEAPKPDAPKPTASSVADDETKAEVAALRRQLEDDKNKREREALDSESRTITIGIRSGLKSVAFNGKDAADEDARRENVETLIKSKYTAKLNDNNELVFYNKEGEVVTDSDTQRAITLDKLVKRDFGFAFGAEPVQTVGGTGTKKDQDVFREIDVNGEKVQAYVGKSMTEIRKKSAELGLAVGSPKRTAFINASAKASNLDPNGI